MRELFEVSFPIIKSVVACRSDIAPGADVDEFILVPFM